MTVLAGVAVSPWRASAAPPSPSSAPPPRLALTVTGEAPDRPWTLRVENLDDVPVRLVADARLLILEVTPEGAEHSIRCALPSDMRPGGDDERGLILPPRRAYAETFDPRLYCFGTREAAALIAGANVVAHLGWMPRGKRTKPPYVAAPIEGVEPERAPLMEIISDARHLPAPPPPSPVEAGGAPRVAPEGDVAPKLLLSGPHRVDVGTPVDVALPITLTNQGPRSVTLLFRPETLAFDVIGPTGSTPCKWAVSATSPIRELFTTVPPHGSASVAVSLSALCEAATFESPGIYSATPRLDTRHASGQSINLRTFDAELASPEPTLIRVRAARVPLPRARPTLEPAAETAR